MPSLYSFIALDIKYLVRCYWPCLVMKAVFPIIPPSPLALAKSPTLLALAGTLALALAPLSACGTSSLATLGTSSLGRTTCVRNHYILKEENNGKYPVIFYAKSCDGGSSGIIKSFGSGVLCWPRGAC